jgi:hypothetical protein
MGARVAAASGGRGGRTGVSSSGRGGAIVGGTVHDSPSRVTRWGTLAPSTSVGQ